MEFARAVVQENILPIRMILLRMSAKAARLINAKNASLEGTLL